MVEKEEYVLGSRIGNGAAGLVHTATRAKDEAERAVKFLAPDPKYIDEDAFDDVAARFRREGQRGAKLDHDRLLDIFAYSDNKAGSAFIDQGPSNPFILTERVRGTTLERYIRRLPTSDQGVFLVNREKLEIAVQITQALEYLHQRRLVHRDVKPANIFLYGGRAERESTKIKLGDFGVVKWGEFHASLATGELTVSSQAGLGTQKYMSPEQALSAKEVTVRADIFSLGICLMELFAGQIFPGPHHVFRVMTARLSRGTTQSRFNELGYKIDFQDDDLGELLLNMYLRGPSGRPAISIVRGRLEWLLSARYEEEFA